ncbi:MAG: hypothetical protein ACPGTQ_00380 [Colwellia sp.]
MKNIILAIIAIAYPFIIYYGLAYIEPAVMAGVFAVFFIVRYLNQKHSKFSLPHLNIILGVVLTLLIYSAIANSAMALKFYPVIVSLCFLGVFAYSLYKPPSVVEMIARLHEDIDSEGVLYTRKVTLVWCCFFICNAFISSLTVFHPDESLWLLYNGLVSYLLMGLLMAAEFTVRYFVKRAKTKSKAH